MRRSRSAFGRMFLKAVVQHFPRLTWSREKLAEFQRDRLRRVVAAAKQNSPWHGRRLAHLDADTLELEDLQSIPVMTKADVMEQFDEIVTDRRVMLKDCLEHLHKTEAGAWFLDEYKVVTSSGSSGRVGIWPYEREAWKELQAGNVRMGIRSTVQNPSLFRGFPSVAVVAASSPTHLSAQSVKDMGGVFLKVHEFPVTLSFNELLEKLERIQPTLLSGYPSMLGELAHATQEGRLHIEPTGVECSAEPLLDSQRKLIEETWSCKVINIWAASEGGPLAVGCGEQPGMHISEDLVVLEPVDDDDNLVASGQTAAKVYVTNLYNTTLPLLRYELDDSITPMDEPCSCGVTFRKIEDIQGRFDEIFHYGEDVRVHTHVFRTVLGLETNMTDYQVLQTEGGARLLLRANGEIDTDALAERLKQKLQGLGLRDPRVEVDLDSPFRRLKSGKIKRYVPLGFSGLAEGDG